MAAILDSWSTLHLSAEQRNIMVITFWMNKSLLKSYDSAIYFDNKTRKQSFSLRRQVQVSRVRRGSRQGPRNAVGMLWCKKNRSLLVKNQQICHIVWWSIILNQFLDHTERVCRKLIDLRIQHPITVLLSYWTLQTDKNWPRHSQKKAKQTKNAFPSYNFV